MVNRYSVKRNNILKSRSNKKIKKGYSNHRKCTVGIRQKKGEVSMVEKNTKKLNSSFEENIRYMNYDDKMPDISLGLERDSQINENRIVFKISKPLFYYNADLENEKTSYLQQEILLNQKIEENSAEKLKIKSNYANYIKEYRVLKNKAELEKNKYEIKKLEYSLGKIDYLEVMESFDDYMEYEVSQEKAKNILNSYVYEIMVKGE